MIKPERLLKLTPAQQDELDTRLVRQGYTARQRQVIILRCQYRFTKTIAKRLGIAQSTVDFHLSAINRESGCRNHQDLVEFVQELLNIGPHHLPESPRSPLPSSKQHQTNKNQPRLSARVLPLILVALLTAFNISQSRASETNSWEMDYDPAWRDTGQGWTRQDAEELTDRDFNQWSIDDSYGVDEDLYPYEMEHQIELERAREYYEDNY
jgi:DNA-binding CsgD family transcriptional regulator